MRAPACKQTGSPRDRPCVAALSAAYAWPEMFRYAEPAFFWPIIFVAAAAQNWHCVTSR
jgi:hypothetical protein